MIEPKRVVISCENEIDEGWRLVSPAAFSLNENPFFEESSVVDICKAITYAKKVVLRLFEPCLPRSVMDELKWVSQYAPVELEAIDNALIYRYDEIGLSRKMVDSSIKTNLITIEGKEKKSYLIGDGFHEVAGQSTEAMASLQGATKIYLFGEAEKELRLMLSKVKKTIPVIWVVPMPSYSKEALETALSLGVDLFVATNFAPGTIVETAKGELFNITPFADGQDLYSPIQKLSNYGDGLYVPCGFIEKVACSDVPANSCYFTNGEMKPLKLEPTLEKRHQIAVSSMSDFVNARFDSDITKRHNDYALEAKKVDYLFILNAPRENENANESSLYEPIKAGETKWQEAQRIDFVGLKKALVDLYPNKGSFSAFFDEIIGFTKKLKTMVSHCRYHGYYALLREMKDSLSSIDETALAGCAEIYSSIATENSGTRFFKFDDEIEGYRATIAEKTSLIEQGVEVLSNKRRVEILNRKIEDLLKMKQHFQKSASSSDEKSLKSFLSLCNDLLEGSVPKTVSAQPESIEKVIAMKEDSKEVRLNAFVRKLLPTLKSYSISCIAIINELLSIRIPEDNQVIDQNGESYLLIDEESEFANTEAIREELHLGCLARR